MQDHNTDNTVNQIVSKILVHETSAQAQGQLREFCQAHNLLGLKDHGNKIMAILHSHTDLGGAFLCEQSDEQGHSGLQIGLQIHQIRPELPLFLRRQSLDTPLPAQYDGVFAGCYTIDDLAQLKTLVDDHLFCSHYPMPLIRGIQELSNQAFHTTISNIKVTCDPPYMVKDQLIYGELFSLIPLESHWCRGFMMLQTTESQMMTLIANGRTSLSNQNPTFREVNHLINEITNMVWGGIKSRFFVDDGNDEQTVTNNKIHVPIMINHRRKFISFGTSEPHLCFRYVIESQTDDFPRLEIYQKLIFNLNWQPERFKECNQAVDDMVDSGELELF
ncbi:MAG: hypothetical protein ACI9FJ_001533 [Alteromonadaceae bacterium]|jgi:hypothetical protein